MLEAVLAAGELPGPAWGIEDGAAVVGCDTSVHSIDEEPEHVSDWHDEVVGGRDGACAWRDWVILVALLGLAVGLAGCSRGGSEGGARPPDRRVEVRRIDFIGEVQKVTFGPAWAMLPPGIVLTPGGPSGPASVGPQTLVLQDGRHLDVPAKTPGGNTCLDLIHPSQVARITGEPSASVEDVPRFESNRDWTVPCIVIGQQEDGSGPVTWFAVLQVWSPGLAELGIVDRLDSATQTIITKDGYQLPTDVDESDCGSELDDQPSVMALVDPASGRVAALTCLPYD